MDKQIVIIDNGSGFCKAGFSGDKEPKVVIPSVVGHQKSFCLKSDDENTLVFGQEALDNKYELDIISPVRDGKITEWDDMKYFFNYLFEKQLKIDPSQCGLFLTEKPLTPIYHREKLTELLFEDFNAPSIFITNGAVLSLYGALKFSGIVVDSGYDSTMFVPMRNGYPFTSTISHLNLGGKDISNYLELLLNKKGYNKVSNIDLIKENHCFVSIDPYKEKTDEISVELPDNNIIKLKDEKYLPTELFYHPEEIGKEMGGIARKLCESLYKADRCIKEEIQGNVVIAGGNTLFKGFEDRFKIEVQKCVGGTYKDRVNLISIPERKYLSWIGGSIFSLMSIFGGLCTSRSEYNEYGTSAVHDKCFY